MCISFSQRKEIIFHNLYTKNTVYNKRFWLTVKPFFSDKNRVKKRTALVEDKNKAVSDKKLVAETFNKFFCKYCPIARIAM